MINENSEIQIEMASITKVFKTPHGGKTNRVLSDFNMAINKGEIVSLVGPSGCGKSTLLNLILGFDKDYTGTITYKEEACPIDKGMIFQTPELFSWLSVKNNIGYGLKIRNMPLKERSILTQEFLLEIDLEAYQDYYPEQLSGGMQQRVALARTLILNPELLMMDEPFSALDYQSRLHMQNLTLKLWEKNKPTILFVTHDIEEAIILSDRILVMQKEPGKVIKEIISPFKRPRDISVMRDSAFNLIKLEILDLLKI